MRPAFAVVLFCALTVAANSQSSEGYVHQLEATYKRARTLQANFLEVYREGGRAVRTESGVAYFRRPGKMRWEYASPEKNLFVVDGKFAWFFVPADHTVSRVAARDSADWRTPLALLAGEMKVGRFCTKVELAPTQPASAATIRLNCSIRGTEREAKAGAPHDTAYFDIAKSTGQLESVVVAGAAGVTMEMRFSNWKFDPPAPDTLFHFQPEKGIAIVDGDQLLSAPGQPLP
ncbi:MAG TPA: outer-membrane lipoprotein carrier protein LolA [Candidatus Acidoferrum sp.]|nr:outer-membrane lipoprotein carrier protein LolA [Candidatus Acidoferrum sp.]